MNVKKIAFMSLLVGVGVIIFPAQPKADVNADLEPWSTRVLLGDWHEPAPFLKYNDDNAQFQELADNGYEIRVDACEFHVFSSKKITVSVRKSDRALRIRTFAGFAHNKIASMDKLRKLGYEVAIVCSDRVAGSTGIVVQYWAKERTFPPMVSPF